MCGRGELMVAGRKWGQVAMRRYVGYLVRDGDEALLERLVVCSVGMGVEVDG